MKVLKFGGTSVANPAHIGKVRAIVAHQGEGPLAVVVSAFGGVTDLLLESSRSASDQDPAYKDSFKNIEDRHIRAIKELLPLTSQSAILSKVKSDLNTLETLLEGSFLIGELSSRLSDKIVGYGELLSAYIITEYFASQGLDAVFKDSRELILTDNHYGAAHVDPEGTKANCNAFFGENPHKITVLPGFVAKSRSGHATTLGRGGSDYTAALIAAAQGAEILEIWTDVSGMYTANPKWVKQAKCISNISYEEAMELSHFGAKVIYPPSIYPVLAQGIPIQVKNTFEPESPGTHISRNINGNGKTVRGISHVGNISLISLEGPGMVGTPGISKRFFETLAQNEISIVMITQASSEHSICVGVADADAARAVEAVDETFAYEISTGKVKPVQLEGELTIVALVGDNMKSHQGLSGKMFSTLGRNNVNIRAIAQGASERNISAVIKKEDVKKALNSLHETFFEENIKQLNLFVMGVGNVGSKLLEQLGKQKKYLKEELRLNLRVIGIANSRQMYFDENGIDLRDWQGALAQGEKADGPGFVQRVRSLNLRNSVFVDNTANAQVAQSYPDYLRNSISVVTCNKIACSSDHAYYRELKELSKRYGAAFLFETNVGAGLPIIDTLKHLIASGDQVRKIQAILSGSLNFVFNNFNDSTPFHQVVQEAQRQGYTEPDPSIDLSGTDVMRKILILARESGHRLELGDIANESFLPQESLEAGSKAEFYASLDRNEARFQAMYHAAEEADSKLKYVAQFENGKAKVGLERIPRGHDFYHLEGSDNIVLFYTQRYPDRPMIIKGAGAGADVTASGIFADIIRIGNH